MASSSSRGAAVPAPTPRKPSISAKATDDPILRNTLRYTISAREYALLHRYILSRSRQIKKRVPTVENVNRMMYGDASVAEKASGEGKGDEPSGLADISPANPRSTGAGANAGAGAMVGSDDYNARAVRHSVRVFVGTAVALKAWGIIAARLMGQKQDPRLKKQPLYNSPVFRLPLSLSSILLLYRLLFRFFTRLRLHILAASAEPFRKRNPKTSRTLTSPYAPAIGASLAGLALGVYPAEQLRVTIAIYAMFRALEFGWNYAEDGGLIWGQEKNGRTRKRPWWFGSWMLQPFALGQLLHAYTFDLDCFPKAIGDFITKNSSPYLRERPKDYPPGLDWPSTGEVIESLAQMARLNWPLLVRALRMSTFATGSISTAWASICFFQTWLPRTLLATQRFFLGGFLAGLWAWVERKQGRAAFLYTARASVDSFWKVGVKRRWWKAMRAGDVWVFVLAVMLTGVVYEKDAQAVREGSWRKGISWMRGQGFRDWAMEEEDFDEDGKGVRGDIDEE
ncbi:hypothetical protein SLS53_003751 [Cytospora paraplurivora]|uniref:Uncharacterized protein n=1 Tax=Cytospora paraplurivora TaxID=2898453 RepID=A0AAN9YJ23_9PEZI